MFDLSTNVKWLCMWSIKFRSACFHLVVAVLLAYENRAVFHSLFYHYCFWIIQGFLFSKVCDFSANFFLIDHFFEKENSFWILSNTPNFFDSTLILCWLKWMVIDTFIPFNSYSWTFILAVRFQIASIQAIST